MSKAVYFLVFACLLATVSSQRYYYNSNPQAAYLLGSPYGGYNYGSRSYPTYAYASRTYSPSAYGYYPYYNYAQASPSYAYAAPSYRPSSAIASASLFCSNCGRG